MDVVEIAEKAKESPFYSILLSLSQTGSIIRGALSCGRMMTWKRACNNIILIFFVDVADRSLSH